MGRWVMVDGPSSQITWFLTNSQLLHKRHLQAFGCVLQFLFSSSFESCETYLTLTWALLYQQALKPPPPQRGGKQWSLRVPKF